MCTKSPPTLSLQSSKEELHEKVCSYIWIPSLFSGTTDTGQIQYKAEHIALDEMPGVYTATALSWMRISFAFVLLKYTWEHTSPTGVTLTGGIQEHVLCFTDGNYRSIFTISTPTPNYECPPFICVCIAQPLGSMSGKLLSM